MLLFSFELPRIFLFITEDEFLFINSFIATFVLSVALFLLRVGGFLSDSNSFCCWLSLLNNWFYFSSSSILLLAMICRSWLHCIFSFSIVKSLSFRTHFSVSKLVLTSFKRSFKCFFSLSYTCCVFVMSLFSLSFKSWISLASCWFSFIFSCYLDSYFMKSLFLYFLICVSKSIFCLLY